jgi:dipeptidase E
MQRRAFLTTSLAGIAGVAAARAISASSFPRASTPMRKILIAGGGFRTAFIRYMAELTGKPRPKLLYLPTASADSPEAIANWFEYCKPLKVEASVQKSFIESLSQTRSWEEVFLSVDGIVCSGGNTLNQQAIWKAQGIDVILRKAWDQGIVLGGASAGSLCWFEEGTTDSRPQALSVVQGLGFLKGSHSPHYDAEPGRRPLYQKLISSGQMKPGWACDNDAGIYFEDNTAVRAVTAREGAKVYFVSAVNGQAVEKVYEPGKI